jgi:hypothetical protein
MRDFYYVDEGGILSYPDGRPMSPADAAAKINELVQENTRYRDRLQIDPGGSDKIDELQQAVQFLRQPIHNPPGATGEYVDVMGEMTILFTVQLPVEHCHEPIACDDPAVEAALQAVSDYSCTYLWGEDKKPAVVYCDVGDQNVEIESDDRLCSEKIPPGLK